MLDPTQIGNARFHGYFFPAPAFDRVAGDFEAANVALNRFVRLMYEARSTASRPRVWKREVRTIVQGAEADYRELLVVANQFGLELRDAKGHVVVRNCISVVRVGVKLDAEVREHMPWDTNSMPGVTSVRIGFWCGFLTPSGRGQPNRHDACRSGACHIVLAAV
jgi:hypothetical protein